MSQSLKIAALAVTLIFASALGQQAAAQLGIAAGANFDQMTDISTNGEATFDNATGYHVGLFFDFGTGPLAVRPGVFYMNVGAIDFEAGNVTDQVDVDLFEVPVDLRLRLMAAPVARPYLLAGPTFRFAWSDDDDYDDWINDVSMAANAGVGIEINVPNTGLRFFPELRYAFGLTDFTDDAEFRGIEFEGEDASYLNTFMLRLGVAF